MTVEALTDALAGRFDRWYWSAGLTTDVVGHTLGIELTTGSTWLAGQEMQQTIVDTPEQLYPVRMRWTDDGELFLVEISRPNAHPSWPEMIDALGRPDVVFAFGGGPLPGSDQRCHLSRGLTVFDGGGLGYEAVWLYPPMTEDEYQTRTGAMETVRRRQR